MDGEKSVNDGTTSPATGQAKGNAAFPKLFVADLDDTALGGGYQPYARFPDHFSDFLDRLSECGCRWAINTTWDVHGQWQVVQSSKVRSRPSYLIAEYGLRVAHVTSEGPDFIQPYTQEMEARQEEVNQSELLPLIRNVCSRFKPAKMHFYGHVFEFHPRPEDADALAAYIREEYGESKLLRAGAGRALGVVPKFLNKGNGLREVMRIEKLSPMDVVTAGDSMPDTTMMTPELSANPLCPGNARAEIKEFVRSHGGAVGESVCARGIIEAFENLSLKRGWEI